MNQTFAFAFLAPGVVPPTLEAVTRTHTLTTTQLNAGAPTPLTTGPTVAFSVPSIAAGSVQVLPASNRQNHLTIVNPVDGGLVYVASGPITSPLLAAPLYPGNLVDFPHGYYDGPLWAINALNTPSTIFTVSN